MAHVSAREFSQDGTVWIDFRFWNRLKRLIDPDEVIVYWKRPDGTQGTVPHEGILRISTGVYSARLDIKEPGWHRITCEAETEDGKIVRSKKFFVYERMVQGVSE